MKPFLFHNTLKISRVLIPLAALGLGSQAMAQAPSSLSYPTPSVFIANVSNVFLSPNLAGNATSYSIAPTLPAGLSFNPNTGVIAGVPTVASAATDYTITAHGAGSQSASFLAGIQVTNNFFNNNYSSIKFGGPGVIVLNGADSSTISNTSNTSVGRAVGDVVVYRNVATLSGQAIDCIVKTVAMNGVVSWTAYDQASPNGGGYSDNDPAFFSPQLKFANGTSSGPGGTIQFNFQFILGGTYRVATRSGLPVVLQNVKINTYDIDGNGDNNSNQINEFGGFSTSEVGNPTTLQTPVYNANTGLTTYRSSTDDNSMSATADATRVRITYNNISDFSIRLGGGGTAYFFLDFSSGPGFTTAVTTTAPSIDLDTTVLGVNNTGSGCGTNLSFTPPGQNNIRATGNLNRLTVSFPTADILDGASEKLIVKGATNGSIALNSNPNITNLGLNSVNYTVAGTLANGVRTLTFTRNSGAFTVDNAEALLDSLQYSNTDATPTPGSRNFTVNVRNTAFESPNAVFTATLNCVSIKGHVYHDINGMADTLVNATGTSQFAAGDLYVVRVDPANNHVIDVQPIQAGGGFSFGTVTPGAYALYVSTTAPAVGNTFTAATFPATYKPTGEHLGAGTGDDRLTDGKLLITVGSASVTDANFGLQIPPVSSNNTIANIANPGGFNDYSLPGNAFPASDADGKVDSIRITAFPTGANYIKIGNTVYTNGGTCPPQVTSCTAWPGSVAVAMNNGQPVPVISVDPIQEGGATVTIPFKALDDARDSSSANTLTLQFVGSSYYNISGKVWNDANGNGIQDAGENTINTADNGQTLYAVLIQNTHTYSGAPTILMSAPVNANTGYSFSNVPAGNDYAVHIASLTAAPENGAAQSKVVPHLHPAWTSVSTNADGNISSYLNTNDPAVAIPNLTGSKTNHNIGLDRLPEAADASANVHYPSLGTLYTLDGNGTNAPAPAATDPEDGPLGAGNTIVITTLPSFTTLLYDGQPVTLNQQISNFEPSKLQIKITTATIGQSGTSFQFSYADAARVTDPTPATYAISWGAPLPVTMGSFKAIAEGSAVRLDWITYSEKNNLGFAIERSNDSRHWIEIGFTGTAADGGNSNERLDYSAYDNSPVSGLNFYRLKQTDRDGHYTYTEVRQVSFGKENAINIYPNPATDILNITVGDWKDITDVRILDINGKQVFQAREASNGISLGKLSRGTYMLQVEQTNGNITQFKIVKL
ncbi:T9SS type A sorting domain-containing protein [Taibaiella koreensis]|uniref:T9SS type A sorting domain-containing protein n=1 Tax=Taibaiella koreensis TaxID=1268548 RepID=UPI000E59C21B|nr:T9SS type A sorting domain-containing protein [Taibaiella koreensis]